jgi:alkanesulfonate monooxygenase SsuD/methylene tetrahydromethanopterin reductase-like flavin-dependent oxidoreductase (luciferase family)
MATSGVCCAIHTIRWAAQQAAWPIIFSPIKEIVDSCLDAYHDEALRYPGEEGPIPNNYRAMVDRGYSLTGSVDTVARKLEKVIEDFDTDLLVLWQGIGPAPIDKMLKSNELLVDKVLPKLGISLEQFKPTLRPEFETPLWTETPPIR